MHRTNEAVTSFRWLIQNLGARDASSRISRSWQRVRNQMRGTVQSFTSSQDWISDFWICKTANASVIGLGVQPGWDPPDELDEWPSVPSGLLQAYHPEDMRQTNHSAFVSVLNSAPDVVESSSDTAVSEFYALDDATTRIADVAMIQAQYVRAWLSTAIGTLLSSVALSPQKDHEPLERESRRRLLIPRELKAAPLWGVQFAEGAIGILYNCRQSPLGTLSWRGIRIGQGEEWMKHWQWLSQSVDAAHVIPAVVLAAKLLRCRPLLVALTNTLEANDPELEDIAVAVLRRWLLSLKAMAWLEDALERQWDRVRPEDLACFAFNAVKPDWPRRVLAVSHRSMDAKPALFGMNAWRSSLFAIDANYAPSWETNTGMIWGLFAATPVLVKISSPNYELSEWCQREEEVLRYVEHTCDFMDRRFVLDMTIERVASLDRFVAAWRPLSKFRSWIPEFPPPCNVYFPGTLPEWALRMLRAAAALRVFHATYAVVSADAANRLAQLLCSSAGLPPIPPPTNNADGWGAYRQVFRDLQTECGLEEDAVPLWFPAKVAPWHLDRVQAFSDAIPDLSQGRPSLADVLPALEWGETVLPLLEEANLGDMTVIDLRGLSKHPWETAPALSMTRGIAAMRSPPRPVWFLQSAGQSVDTWDLPQDHPIFTQYIEEQFAWMMVEGTLSPEWPHAYAERCGLIMSAPLLAKCRATRQTG
jgi:hypothetical protein